MRTTAQKIPLRQSATDTLFQRGLGLHQSGHIDEAAKLYRDVLRIRPRHPEALSLLGTARAQLGDLQGGLEWLERALVERPADPNIRANHAQTLNQLAGAALQTGRIREAVDLFKHALDSNPSHVDARMNLGVAYCRLREFDAAEEAFLAVLEIAPDNGLALHNLGLARRSRGDTAGALKALWRAVSASPDDDAAWATFADVFERVRFGDDADAPALTSVLEALLQRDGIDHRSLAPQIIRLMRRDPHIAALLEVTTSGSEWALNRVFADETAMKGLDQPFVRLALQHTILPDWELEQLLRRARRAALAAVVGTGPVVSIDMMASLARQCFLNGYVWAYEPEEVTMVEWIVASMDGRPIGDQPADAAKLCVMACYVPLCAWERAEEAAVFAASGQFPALAPVVLEQIIEPVTEANLRDHIPTFALTDDDVSHAVREHYEAHPYPRWTSIARRPGMSVADAVRGVAPTASLPGIEALTEPEVLVAGCGTGKQLIDIALRFRDAKVTGLDLSLSSLSYAARKASELGFDDVELVSADILSLDAWPRTFDIVACGGVLHHLADPVRGWRILRDRVRPGGFMHIALYSEGARRPITEARAHFGPDFDPNDDAIRAARAEIMEHFADLDHGPHLWRDFYSLEECRDMIFPAQEHLFTLPRLAEVLDELGLEFLGFDGIRSETMDAFRALFPNPEDARSLAAWHSFETENPLVFAAMYQFWVAVPAA